MERIVPNGHVTPNGHSTVEQPAASDPSRVGRLAAPAGAEATTEQFYFWAQDDRPIEKTQLVHLESPFGAGEVSFYGMVSEVYRRSRRADVLEEADRFDGRVAEELPVQSRGVTYAQVRLLATRPNVFAPPREESTVYAAGAAEARVAYGVDEMGWPVAVGRVRNGAEAVAGPAYLDLDYVLGALGGHMNVTGIAGVGTKSSFLTIVMQQIVRACLERALADPADPDRPQVRPVILNVKGYDLFWLDHWSTAFTEADRAAWREMGWNDPAPLTPLFYAPQQPGSDDLPVSVGRSDVKPYSWSLEDVVVTGLFPYLFADGDREDDNFALLVADVERLIVRETRAADGTAQRALRTDAAATTFAALFEWFENGISQDGHGDAAFNRLAATHHAGTLRRFFRRLRRVVYESAGIFRMGATGGHPLALASGPVGTPIVVDIHSLPDRHLQRFVVAALLKQAVEDRTGPGALRGMYYLFVLDELNRFAPRGHSDPITQLVETVAAELRSRGVILLGAQQQASLVSPRVVENASACVLGRTGSHELQQDCFGFLHESLRHYVGQLGSADKVVQLPCFREPMHVRVPRPPWAMRRQEASREPPAFMGAGGARPIATGPRRLPPPEGEDF